MAAERSAGVKLIFLTDKKSWQKFWGHIIGRTQKLQLPKIIPKACPARPVQSAGQLGKPGARLLLETRIDGGKSLCHGGFAREPTSQVVPNQIGVDTIGNELAVYSD